jgi:hypothetical protein
MRGTSDASREGLVQRRACLSLFGLASAVACGMGDFSFGPGSPPSVPELHVRPEKVAVPLGGSVQFSVARTSVRWTSNNPSVATVDSHGLVTPVALGSVGIVATDGGVLSSADVTAITPPTALRFVSVSAGADHTCGLTTDCAAYCWGADLAGELGDSNHTTALAPTRVVGDLTFVALTAGRSSGGTGDHTCGLTADGSAYCWGGNDNGELGNGTIGGAGWTPQLVVGNHRFSSISAGYTHSCGITADETALCWGRNYAGQLGMGSPDNVVYDSAVTVVGDFHFVTISAGTSESCALTPSGSAFCWGNNWDGQLGSGAGVTENPVPLPVSGGLAFMSVSVGAPGNVTEFGFACGVTTSGAPYCWGNNSAGQLGDGTTVSSAYPRPVAGALQPPISGRGVPVRAASH